MSCLEVPPSALFSVDTALTLKGAGSECLVSSFLRPVQQLPLARLPAAPGVLPRRDARAGGGCGRSVLGASWFQVPGVHG